MPGLGHRPDRQPHRDVIGVAGAEVGGDAAHRVRLGAERRHRHLASRHLLGRRAAGQRLEVDREHLLPAALDLHRLLVVEEARQLELDDVIAAGDRVALDRRLADQLAVDLDVGPFRAGQDAQGAGGGQVGHHRDDLVLQQDHLTLEVGEAVLVDDDVVLAGVEIVAIHRRPPEAGAVQEHLGVGDLRLHLQGRLRPIGRRHLHAEADDGVFARRHAHRLLDRLEPGLAAADDVLAGLDRLDRDRRLTLLLAVDEDLDVRLVRDDAQASSWSSRRSWR